MIMTQIDQPNQPASVPARTGESPQPRGGGFDRKNTGHGMLNAGHVASRWKVACRHVLMVLLSKLPGSNAKSRMIAKMLGVKMGQNVGLAYGVYLDPYDPTMISFGDNVLVGFGTKIFVHAFTLNRQRVKPVKIGSNVMIGGFCVIAPGVTIGDGASIAPGTIVSRNVPEGAMAMGNVMRIHKRGSKAAEADAATADSHPENNSRP
jgi:acetyltransferase-like isoleucine patch superfamily enzyme